jgi:hypothetical protein
VGRAGTVARLATRFKAAHVGRIAAIRIRKTFTAISVGCFGLLRSCSHRLSKFCHQKIALRIPFCRNARRIAADAAVEGGTFAALRRTSAATKQH